MSYADCRCNFDTQFQLELQGARRLSTSSPPRAGLTSIVEDENHHAIYAHNQDRPGPGEEGIYWTTVSERRRPRGGSLPQFFVPGSEGASLFDSGAYSPIEGDESERMPLMRQAEQGGKGKGRGRRGLGFLLGNLGFRRSRKASSGAQGVESSSPAVAQPIFPSLVRRRDCSEDPFADEHAIVCDASPQTRSSCFGDVRSDGRRQDHDVDADAEMEDEGLRALREFKWESLPQTPPRKSNSSVSTTPGSSPTAWMRRTPRTPGSAKSWKSELSASSELSAVSSMRRKQAKRKATMASQTKLVQTLGSEAVRAVAQATGVKENKLRFRDFDRQVREELRRQV